MPNWSEPHAREKERVTDVVFHFVNTYKQFDNVHSWLYMAISFSLCWPSKFELLFTNKNSVVKWTTPSFVLHSSPSIRLKVMKFNVPNNIPIINVKIFDITTDLCEVQYMIQSKCMHINKYTPTNILKIKKLIFF